MAIMKKFSFQYVKENPIMFGGIVIVFGLLLWLMLNRGSGSGSTVIQNRGPSDAEIMAGAQMAQAQLASQTQIALATIQQQGVNQQAAIEMAKLQTQLDMHGREAETAISLASLEANLRAAELAANERMSKFNTEAQVGALNMQLDYALRTTEANNSFAYEYARLAYDASVETVKVNAALQATMGAQQLEAFKTGTYAQLEQYKIGTDAAIKQDLISSVDTLKKKDRDETLQIIGGAITGNPVSFVNGPGSALVYGSAGMGGSVT